MSTEMTLELILHTEFTPDFTGYPVHMRVYKYRFGAMSAKLSQGHPPVTKNAKLWSVFLLFFHPHQACPYCHPASSMRSVTSASPLSLWSASSIQPHSRLAPFLFPYSLEQGLTVTRESREEAKKESLTYNNIFCMCIFAAWLFSLLDVVV